MKKVIYLLFLLIIGAHVHSQNLANFFYSPGCKDVAYMAHPSNTIDHVTYNVQDDYVIVDAFYTDNIETRLALKRGFGSLYFTSITSLYDNDFVDPFVAFGLESAFLAELGKEVNPQKYNEVRQSLKDVLGTDPENWDGYGWALFAINLDFISHYGGNSN